MVTPRIVAFIPARSGSTRIPDKNIMDLAGHPLIAYTIRSAIDSGIFEEVIFVTDSSRYADIARGYGIERVFGQEASETRSEYDAYLRNLVATLKAEDYPFDCFSILRPTSPFRTAETIKRAWGEWLANQPCDSLRAMEPVKQHPGKMYEIYGPVSPRAIPAYDHTDCRYSIPMRDKQIQALPPLWVQNGSLEIAWTKTVQEYLSFSGATIYPFKTEGAEGIDLNRPEDVAVAKWMIETGKAKLPAVEKVKKAAKSRRVVQVGRGPRTVHNEIIIETRGK